MCEFHPSDKCYNKDNKYEWGFDDTFELIEAYKNEPCLWNPNNTSYKLISAKRRAFCRIAAKFGCPPSEIKRKITSLLSSFRRERRLQRQFLIEAPSASAAQKYRPKWFAFKRFEFLLGKYGSPTTDGFDAIESLADNQTTINEKSCKSKQSNSISNHHHPPTLMLLPLKREPEEVVDINNDDDHDDDGANKPSSLALYNTYQRKETVNNNVIISNNGDKSEDLLVDAGDYHINSQQELLIASDDFDSINTEHQKVEKSSGAVNNSAALENNSDHEEYELNTNRQQLHLHQTTNSVNNNADSNNRASSVLEPDYSMQIGVSPMNYHSRYDEAAAFGDYVALKLRNYGNRTKNIVQHRISTVLFEADMGNLFGNINSES